MVLIYHSNTKYTTNPEVTDKNIKAEVMVNNTTATNCCKMQLPNILILIIDPH